MLCEGCAAHCTHACCVMHRTFISSCCCLHRQEWSATAVGSQHLPSPHVLSLCALWWCLCCCSSVVGGGCGVVGREGALAVLWQCCHGDCSKVRTSRLHFFAQNVFLGSTQACVQHQLHPRVYMRVRVCTCADPPAGAHHALSPAAISCGTAPDLGSMFWFIRLAALMHRHLPRVLAAHICLAGSAAELRLPRQSGNVAH